MASKRLIILSLLVLFPAAVVVSIEEDRARVFGGQDIWLKGTEVLSQQLSTGEHVLVFQDKFSMSIGANEFSSNKAVVWLKVITTEIHGRSYVDYDAKVYLEGDISVTKSKGSKAVAFQELVVEAGQISVLRFVVSGEVLVTADKRQSGDAQKLELYLKASMYDVPVGPVFIVQAGAIVPKMPSEELPEQKVWPSEKVAVEKPVEKQRYEYEAEPVEKGKSEFIKTVIARQEQAEAKSRPKEPSFVYPVNISPAGEASLEWEWSDAEDGSQVVTVTERFYLWQKQDERGGLMELQADNAVIFYTGKGLEKKQDPQAAENVFAKGAVKAIYMSGDVLLTEGSRTIRADEIFYDFKTKKAIAINAVMRSYDVKRGMPIYVRAARLRQVTENQFAAENIVMTSSEFYKPQLSFTASSFLVTDTTSVDQQADKLSDSSYDAQMKDVRLKVGDRTVFYWPFMRSNMLRPDLPIKRLSVGHDTIWGTSVETEWYLSRLLGLKEPEGVESTLALDHFSKRGFGTGAEIEYRRDDYFGKINGYVIRDEGEDRLGRNNTRRNLDPGNDIRGRFSLRHRHFLPYKWQLTTEFNYLSDENFLEQYYRREFGVGGGHETYVHLKRIEDNRAISILIKPRINDFSDELEELPSVEYHMTGESIFGDAFTLYSDTQVSRMRQRIGDRHTTTINQDIFTFATHRTELDMPLNAGIFKVVPFVAGTFGYDDRSGFRRSLVDGSNTGEFGEDQVWFAELGVRISARPFWKVYPNIKSQLWDLNQLRHIVRPHLTAVHYNESDNVIEQRDTLNVGLSQRLQTKRGPAGQQRLVDWMRLDTDVTWVDDPADSSAGADKFIWAKPIVPLRVFSSPDIFNGDLTPARLHRFEMFGPRRNYFGADYAWRLSDTTVVMSDLNYDMQSGVVQQYNVGFSRLSWPNLSYYIGSRYLRRVEVLDEKGTNAFTFAATYRLDPRYTLVFSQQFDFDYNANIRSDITLIRRYHRMFYSLTFSVDESLDREAIVFSLWPQGIPEMALGKRKYVNFGGHTNY